MLSDWSTDQALRRVNTALSEVLPRQVERAARRAFVAHGKVFERALVKSQLSGRPGLMRRTGSLAKSFNTTFSSDSESVRFVVWTTSPYARMQEFGGIQRPNGHPYLAIPMKASKTPAGVSKFASPRDVLPFMQQLKRGGESPRDLFFYKSKSGKKFLARSENGKLVVYFMLVDKANIPPRLGMRRLWNDMYASAINGLANELEKEVGAQR